MWTGVDNKELKKWLPYVVNGKIKLAWIEYATLCLVEGGFATLGRNFAIIEGYLTSRITASTGYRLLQFGHYNTIYNYHLFCPKKYRKKLPSKVGYFCKIEEIFPCCLNCPNNPKLQIRVGNLAVDPSVIFFVIWVSVSSISSITKHFRCKIMLEHQSFFFVVCISLYGKVRRLWCI